MSEFAFDEFSSALSYYGMAPAPVAAPAAAPSKPETSSKPERPATAPAAAASSSGGSDLEKAIAAQGDVVRKLKADKAPKDEIKKEVDKLLALKKELESKGSSTPAPGKSPEAEALEKEVAAQGEKVRKLKADKASKDDIKKEVDVLLALKKKLEAVAGPAPAPEPKKPKGESAQDKRKAEKEARKAEREAAKQTSRPVGNETGKLPYGDYPLIKSERRTDRKFNNVEDMTLGLNGKEVWVRARVHNVRGKGKACFLVLRQRTATAQACLFAESDVEKQMVKYLMSLTNESIIDVYGLVAKTAEKVEACSQKDVEIKIKKCFCVSASMANMPFQVEDAARKEGDGANINVLQDTRLDNRWIDIRTPANQAIFRIQSAVCMLFREKLLELGFTEIHTPKLLGAASEGGANVFKLDYFGRPAFLAMSPQLFKQMAVISDFERVFEVAPVFRAENANTHRHLCEFMGLDMEMVFQEHYSEVLDVFDDLFCSIFDGLNNRFARELAAVNEQFPFTPLRYKKPTLRLKFWEGIKMLRDHGEEVDDLEDLSTPHEKLLGRLVAEKYNTDFYMLEKFPTDARPFYTMLDPDDPNYTNSYDIFIRGEEILSGAQRVHDPNVLIERIKSKGLNPDSMKDYVNSFRYGAAPHGGGGIGMERVVMLFLGLHNIRSCSLFPRDPKRLSP